MAVSEHDVVVETLETRGRLFKASSAANNQTVHVDPECRGVRRGEVDVRELTHPAQLPLSARLCEVCSEGRL